LAETSNSTSSRKRPNNPQPETELDSLNAKRLKNREAARRWRQGKKDQISDLQGEVYTLKNKIDAMQTEMESLRIENQYLKQELHKARQTPISTQPAPSPLLSLSSHPFRLAPSPPPSNDINFLPTPSLFLLCLFVFTLCISSLPLNNSFPGTESSGSFMAPLSRQPRLFHKPDPFGQKILSGTTPESNNWIFSMFTQVYQRLLPSSHYTGRNLDEGILKVDLGEINKHISFRLDKFL